MMQMATYIGPPCGWNLEPGMRALIRPSENEGKVLAQFNNFYTQRGGVDQAFGWHEYPSDHFKVDEDAEGYISLEGVSITIDRSNHE